VAKSFLARVQPSRQRWKLIDWPFPMDDGEERPKVKVRVLSLTELEAAHLATIDFFKRIKKVVTDEDTVFRIHENAELVFRAYSVDGEHLAADVAELMDQPIGIIDELHTTWQHFQRDATAAPMTSKDMDAFVDLLKKNMGADLLSALPSSWLIALITTLASQLSSSTLANEHG
jgi:hypothetical protein